MNKSVIYGTFLVGLGLALGVALGSRDTPQHVEPATRHPAASGVFGAPRGVGDTKGGGDWQLGRFEQQLGLLASRVATEVAERRRLEEKIEALATDLAAVRGGHKEDTAAPATTAESGAASGTAPNGAAATQDVSSMEGALLAAGIDATTASDIKRRGDEFDLAEVYLRDLATREGWLNTPRFTEELAKIEQQRTPLREQIGDDAYDRYLAALDHPNRVAVNDVFAESPAAQAGLQPGDVVLRYGDTRIFAPSELVAATRGGTAGEPVQVEIMRAGQRLEIEVPRGPLGVRIAASRGTPAGG
jgi:hypothetical protein